MTAHTLFRRRRVFFVSLLALAVYALLGQRIHPDVALLTALKIDVLALTALGLMAVFRSGAGGWRRVGVGTWGPGAVTGGLLGAAFTAPWASVPWLALPALAIGWAAHGRHLGLPPLRRGLTVALLAALTNNVVVAASSSRGLRVSPEELAAQDVRVSTLLADVPLHDAWVVDLEGKTSPTLDDVGVAFERFSPLQSTPAVLCLAALREGAARALGFESPQWANEEASFVHRLSEEDRRRSTTEPGTDRGYWRVIYAFPREGAMETINGTVHVAVGAAFREGPEGARLFLTFHVRDVNWTTPFYMRLIDPSRRYFLYPFLLKQFAHTWRRVGWDQPEENLTGGD
jgi:hypothetical protein